MVSLLEPGRLRLSSTSTTGSMASRLRLSQPFLILTLASARRFCSVRVIWQGQSQRRQSEGRAQERSTYLGDLGPAQHLVGDFVLLGHGGAVTEEDSQGRAEGVKAWQTSHGGCGQRNSIRLQLSDSSARNVRRGSKRISSKSSQHRPNGQGLGAGGERRQGSIKGRIELLATPVVDSSPVLEPCTATSKLLLGFGERQGACWGGRRNLC